MNFSLDSIKRKLGNLAGGVVSSVKSVIPNLQKGIQDWAQYNPEPAQKIINFPQQIGRQVSGAWQGLTEQPDTSYTNPTSSYAIARGISGGALAPIAGFSPLIKGLTQGQALMQISEKNRINREQNPTFKNPQINQAYNTGMNFLTAGIAFANPLERNYKGIDIKKIFNPNEEEIMRNFAIKVDELGNKANQSNLGELGNNAAYVIEKKFGRKFTTLPNTKIHQLFDYALSKLDKAREAGYGGEVMQPKGVQPPIGLSTQKTKGLAQQALKKPLVPPVEGGVKGFNPNEATPQQQIDIVKNAKIGTGQYKVGEIYTQKVMGQPRPILISKVNPDGSVEGFYAGAISQTEKNFGIDTNSLQPAKWNNPTKELQIPTSNVKQLSSVVEGGVGGVPQVPFQKDLERFTALVKQNDKYGQGVPAIGKLPSSQSVADQMGITHEELMSQVLGKAGKPLPKVLPSTPVEVIPSMIKPLPPTPEGAIPSGMKERGVMKTIRTAEVTTPELKQGVEAVKGESRYYKPYSDEAALKNAQTFINTEGIDTVKKTILTGEYNKTNVAAAELLISKAMKEGRIDEATNLLKELSVKATKSGQANQAWSMWSRVTPEGMLKYAIKEVEKANEKIAKTPNLIKKIFGQNKIELTGEDTKIINDLMTKANSALTDVEKAKYTKMALQTISDKIPIGMSEVIDAFRYNNMLSGLPTHEKNFFQNVWNTFGAEPLVKVAEGRPIEAIKYELGAIKAIPKGLDNFVKVMRREIPIDLGKVDIQQVRLQKLPRPITVFSELMEASDKLFTTIIESAEMGIGKTGAEAKAIAEEYLLRTPIGTKGKGILSDSIDSMVKGIEAFGRSFKPVRWAVPFLRTPFNFGKMWLEFSPVGAANLIGNVNKRNVLAKALLGSVATVIGTKFALEGKTTWAVPTDKEAKEWFYATKRTPFSIKIGEKWIPAQYFGPFAFALLLPAAANYYYNEAPKALTDGDMDKLGKTLTSILSFWSQSSPMANLGGFVKTMEGDIDFSIQKNIAFISIQKNIAFTISQLKPYEGMLRYIANIFDPVYRRPATFGEQMISDIPFLKDTIPDYYKEPTGEPSKREPINFLLPYSIGKSKPEYETYYQGRSVELQINAMETELKNNFAEGKPLPPNASVEMKANLLYSELKKAIENKDVAAINKIKASGIATPEVKKKVQAYQVLEKAGISKTDRDLKQYEGAGRASEVVKRLKTLAPKNRAKHLELLIKAKIVTPEILVEIKKLIQQKQKE